MESNVERDIVSIGFLGVRTESKFEIFPDISDLVGSQVSFWDNIKDSFIRLVKNEGLIIFKVPAKMIPGYLRAKRLASELNPVIIHIDRQPPVHRTTVCIQLLLHSLAS